MGEVQLQQRTRRTNRAPWFRHGEFFTNEGFKPYEEILSAIDEEKGQER
jgi:hypothetical protein